MGEGLYLARLVDSHHVHCRPLLLERQNMCIFRICLRHDPGQILLEESRVQGGGKLYTSLNTSLIFELCSPQNLFSLLFYSSYSLASALFYVLYHMTKP